MKRIVLDSTIRQLQISLPIKILKKLILKFKPHMICFTKKPKIKQIIKASRKIKMFDLMDFILFPKILTLHQNFRHYFLLSGKTLKLFQNLLKGDEYQCLICTLIKQINLNFKLSAVEPKKLRSRVLLMELPC